MMKYEMLLSQNVKIQILLSLSLILFLILYKQFDKIILRKLNRYMYFSTKYLNDKESLDQTSLESLFQVTLVFIPLIFAAIGLLIF